MHVQLCHDKTVVDALFPHQLVVGAHFRHAVLVDHENAIGATQGGQPVGNRKGSAILGEALQRLLNLILGFGVQTAGRFVQNQQPRIV